MHKKLIIGIIVSFICIAAFVAIFMLNSTLFGYEVASFNAFTQNFQNIAMPIVTLVSVLLLYLSISANTKQAKLSQIDELINGHLDNLKSLLSKPIEVPYAIDYILSDYGDTSLMKWDLSRMLIQVNAYISNERYIGHSNVKSAVYDFLSTSCFVNGIAFDDVIESSFNEIVLLLKQRQAIEVDTHRNGYVWNKIELIPPILEYLDLKNAEISAIFESELKYNTRYINKRVSVVGHAESCSNFSDRLNSLQKLSGYELLTTDKEFILKIIEDAKSSAA